MSHDLPNDIDDYSFDDEDLDFEDIDCVECGMKFFVRPSSLVGKEWPTKCPRCVKGLPPLWEE